VTTQALQIESVPIASIHADPANVRRHPERNLDAIKASLARFGQQKPIVVDAKGIVRAGNGTLEAARALGWESISIVRTPLSGSEATAYAIADNRSAELAEWDEAGLGEQLRALQSEDFGLDSVGYMLNRIGGELAGTVVDDPAGEWEGMPEFQHEDKTAHRTLHVHFKDAEAVAAFAELIGQKITENVKYLWYPAEAAVPFETMRHVDES
jgi:ParB-like chromosome segregation protein Spo0J